MQEAILKLRKDFETLKQNTSSEKLKEMDGRIDRLERRNDAIVERLDRLEAKAVAPTPPPLFPPEGSTLSADTAPDEPSAD